MFDAPVVGLGAFGVVVADAAAVDGVMVEVDEVDAVEVDAGSFAAAGAAESADPAGEMFSAILGNAPMPWTSMWCAGVALWRRRNRGCV